ncbi:hypothetical protein BDZ94DRAFT_1262242 [Collybia nuda]|uniref:Uncharacterized protein n=1 Tax=Collybia nuda TaxID=64659 RepID=A0A9P6CIM6_9AGAR|nr:hypothetical protein BDZ94DRAFT_1262242 [Collybia nuda]
MEATIQEWYRSKYRMSIKLRVDEVFSVVSIRILPQSLNCYLAVVMWKSSKRKLIFYRTYVEGAYSTLRIVLLCTLLAVCMTGVVNALDFSNS